jgi:hypothetical protein
MVLRLDAPPFLMRLIVELYDKVPGEYHDNGVSTSSRFRLIEAVQYGTVRAQSVKFCCHNGIWVVAMPCWW